METRRLLAVRSIKLIMTGTIVVPAAIFCFAAWEHRSRIDEIADERIAHSLEISQEHARSVFGTVDVLLSSLDTIPADRSDQGVRLGEAELHKRMKGLIQSVSDIRSVWLFDLAGRPIATSLVFPVPQTLNNADRDYFVAQRDPKQGLYVGQVLAPRVGSEPFFSVSKKLYDSKGQIAGVGAVVISPSVFERFFERLARNSSASYAMIRADGTVLARYPLATKPGIVLSEDSGFRRAVRTNPVRGKYTTVSGVDGLERTFEIQRLDNLPVYVTSSLQVGSLSSEWIEWILLQLAFGIPFIAVLLALEYVALRRTEALYREATRRQEVENTLRQSQKMEAVGQLTGGIAHDFNNLLTIIIGNLQMLVRDLPVDSKLHTRAEHALSGAGRAADLTHRLLAYSRQQPLDPKPINANDVVANAEKLLVPSLGERIRIETSRNAGLWLIEADPTQLESAIINLAVNARDAMPLGGRLTLETSNAYLDEAYCSNHPDLKPGQYVMISVADEGAGMSAETVERAFEPFYTTKKPGLGTGLGLSQVYGFAKQSGGHVRIYSELNVGTTVHLYLPRSTAANPTQLEQRPAETRLGNRECILLVEDDDGVRRHVRDTLVGLNYEVLEANGSEAALKLVEDRSRNIDLLLTDVVMPGLNGRQLSEIAVKQRPGLKVLFMTGYSRNAIVHHGRLDRGRALLQKPITESELSNRIHSLLHVTDQQLENEPS
jgi:two-component system, NtrC family, sensor kinase